MSDNKLMHYGILGMKWGRRKDGRRVTVGPGLRGKLKEAGEIYVDGVKDEINKIKSFGARFNKLRSYASRIKKAQEPSADYTESRKLKKKTIKKLSNQELKTVINRLQLEKQFRDLDRASVDRGRNVVSTILNNVVGKTINAYARTQVDPRVVEFVSEARKNKK